jgi:hypothetical protein
MLKKLQDIKTNLDNGSIASAKRNLERSINELTVELGSGQQEFFTITTITREDIAFEGYPDAMSFTDEEMERFAECMKDSWFESGYWESIDITAGQTFELEYKEDSDI